MSAGTLAIILGLSIGAVIGATVLLTNFCALGGVADILFAKDWRRMRAWLLAAGVAMFGTQALDSLKIVALDQTAYLNVQIFWLPIALGSICFGYGMALAGGCVNRALVRTGAGSLKSFATVVVVGVVAAITAEGLLRPFADALRSAGALEVLSPSGLHRIIGMVPSLSPEGTRWTITVLVGGALVYFSLKDAWFRASHDHLLAGLIVGVMITGAWAASGFLAAKTGTTAGETAINFVGPLGDLLLTIVRPSTRALLPMAIVIGVPVGAFIAGASTRNLAIEFFADRRDALRHLIGAVLMGFGGAIALGCTFGQALSGLSTLSAGSVIAVLGLWFGCLWGIRAFEAESVWGGLRLALGGRPT